MRKITLKMVLPIIILCINNLNFAYATPSKNAFFICVKFNEKISSGKADTWIFTVHNKYCSENAEGDAWFFLRFYLDNEIWWDEYSSTTYKVWLCKRGENVTRGYSIKGLEAVFPVTRKIRVELYWLYEGKSRKEDEISFNVDLTMIIPLRHTYAVSYFAFYIILSFGLAFYYYVSKLEHEHERFRKPQYHL